MLFWMLGSVAGATWDSLDTCSEQGTMAKRLPKLSTSRHTPTENTAVRRMAGVGGIRIHLAEQAEEQGAESRDAGVLGSSGG